MWSLRWTRRQRCRGLCGTLTVLLCASSLSASGQAHVQNVALSVADLQGESDVASSAPVVVLSPENEGDLLMARGSYAAAIRAYQKGTLTSAVLWNKIGVAYHHLFALDQARSAYQTALTIDPHYPAALNNLAAVYHGKHNYKLAERTYKRALKYEPNVAVTYCNLGTSYFADSKYKQGMKAYQQAFRLDPNVFNPDSTKKVEDVAARQQLIMIHYYLAKTYASAGKKEQALEFLRKAFDEGFTDRKRLVADKEFDPIRASPEFQKLLAEQHP
ncbi:MAG TPA: tetratricopeptide repeat protein [Acidobacteriaceae bacterium]|nr:tetratricopeptide repeat protein [Acidobacteriaceae bacterium]